MLARCPMVHTHLPIPAAVFPLSLSLMWNMSKRRLSYVKTDQDQRRQVNEQEPRH